MCIVIPKQPLNNNSDIFTANKLKLKGLEKIHTMQPINIQAAVTMLISGKVYFKSIISDRGVSQ